MGLQFDSAIRSCPTASLLIHIDNNGSDVLHSLKMKSQSSSAVCNRRRYKNDPDFRAASISRAIARSRRPDVVAHRQSLKPEVLTHYGRQGALQCCWPDCGVTDLDMLTLDHVNDDGAAHRKIDTVAATMIYHWVKKHKYPDGFQTLCANHQMKKEIQRRRKRSSQ